MTGQVEYHQRVEERRDGTSQGKRAKAANTNTANDNTTVIWFEPAVTGHFTQSTDVHLPLTDQILVLLMVGRRFWVWSRWLERDLDSGTREEREKSNRPKAAGDQNRMFTFLAAAASDVGNVSLQRGRQGPHPTQISIVTHSMKTPFCVRQSPKEKSYLNTSRLPHR